MNRNRGLCALLLLLAVCGLAKSNFSTVSETVLDEQLQRTAKFRWFPTEEVGIQKTAWDEMMEMSGEWLTKGLTENVVEHILEVYPETNISAACMDSMNAYVKELHRWTPWAVYMADASSKFPSGLLDGTLIDFGGYAQCLDVRSDSFQGQYCMVGHSSPLIATTQRDALGPYVEKYGEPPEWIADYLSSHCGLSTDATFWLAACLPSTCTDEDTRIMYAEVSSAHDINVKVIECQVDEPKEESTYGIYAKRALQFILFLVFIGTVYDVWISPLPSNDKETMTNQSTVPFILRAFSVRHRYDRFQEEWRKETPLDCFHGFRTIACFIVVGGHVYMYPDKYRHVRFSHMTRADTIMSGWETLFYDNAVICLSNFFFLSGFLLAATEGKKLQKTRGEMNFIRFILNKLMRIYPSFMFLVACLFVFPSMSGGPLWNTTWAHFTDNCVNNLWSNLLLVNNYWKIDEQCLPHTWFLSVIMQCQVLGLLVLVIAYRWRKAGVALFLGITFGSFAWAYHISMLHNLTPPSTLRMNDIALTKEYAALLYLKLPIHISTFFLGMLTPFILFKYKDVKLTKKQQILGWTISVMCMYGSYRAIYWVGDYGVYAALYNALNRFVFCIGLIWVVFTCATGYGGPVQAVLSWRPVVIVSNLSFMIYLLHPLFVLFKSASVKEQVYFAHSELVYDWGAVFVISFVAAFFAHIFVEAPFNELTKRLFGNDTSTHTEEEKADEKKTE